MRATSRRDDGRMRNSVEIRGHTLTADESVDHGGDDEGPSPQELLAASLASCSAITMQMYAERKGWEVGWAVVAAAGVDTNDADELPNPPAGSTSSIGAGLESSGLNTGTVGTLG